MLPSSHSSFERYQSWVSVTPAPFTPSQFSYTGGPTGDGFANPSPGLFTEASVNAAPPEPVANGSPSPGTQSTSFMKAPPPDAGGTGESSSEDSSSYSSTSSNGGGGGGQPGMTGGEIAGATVGSVAGAGLLGGLAFILSKGKAKVNTQQAVVPRPAGKASANTFKPPSKVMAADRQALFKELNLPPNATKADVNKAYFKFAKENHPDKTRNMNLPAEEVARRQEVFKSVTRGRQNYFTELELQASKAPKTPIVPTPPNAFTGQPLQITN